MNTWAGTQAIGALREATEELQEEAAAVGEVLEDARRDAYVEERKG